MDAREVIKTPELLPCPFCGGKGLLMGEGGLGAFVKCDTCGASTRYFEDGPVIEYAPKCFTSTDNLRAARAWNIRPGEGTPACAECGVAVPHRHESGEKMSGRLYVGQKHTFVILS